MLLLLIQFIFLLLFLTSTLSPVYTLTYTFGPDPAHNHPPTRPLTSTPALAPSPLHAPVPSPEDNYGGKLLLGRLHPNSFSFNSKQEQVRNPCVYSRPGDRVCPSVKPLKYVTHLLVAS